MPKYEVKKTDEQQSTSREPKPAVNENKFPEYDQHFYENQIEKTESELGDYEDYYREIHKELAIEIESAEKVDNVDIKDYLSSSEDEFEIKTPIQFIIIDGSPINYIDTVGVKMLNQVWNF